MQQKKASSSNEKVGFLKRLLQGIGVYLRGGFLCDSCRYDYDGACSNPERPNARRCTEYRKR